MKKWFIVAGARPNFLKIAPLIRAIDVNPGVVDRRIAHTGQHYDFDMSGSFFKDLAIPKPDYCLDVGSGSHAQQAGMTMVRFEKLCVSEKPDLVVVVGDVNSTLACALAARKLNIPIAHVEAGLRSFDREMPEETNRVLTDHMSDILFCSEMSAFMNLINEGISHSRIETVGDVMVDSLRWQLDRLPDRRPGILQGLEPKSYILLTMHRPSNVDDPVRLAVLISVINEVSKIKPVIFPVHPRAAARIKSLGIELDRSTVFVSGPLNYPTMVSLMKDALLVITDSGGMQVETAYLQVPCLTLRENTERPITLAGTNRLVGPRLERILPWVDGLVHGSSVFRPSEELEKEKTNFLWDGHAAERIVKILMGGMDDEDQELDRFAFKQKK